MEHIKYPTGVELGETIKRAMRAAKVSQNELALQTGISKNTMSRRLNGGGLQYAELVVIADALGRTVSSLVAETEARVQAVAS